MIISPILREVMNVSNNYIQREKKIQSMLKRERAKTLRQYGIKKDFSSKGFSVEDLVLMASQASNIHSDEAKLIQESFSTNTTVDNVYNSLRDIQDLYEERRDDAKKKVLDAEKDIFIDTDPTLENIRVYSSVGVIQPHTESELEKTVAYFVNDNYPVIKRDSVYDILSPPHQPMPHENLSYFSIKPYL